MNSGSAIRVAGFGTSSHPPTPVGGTYKREADGQPARLTNADDYPVTARCRFCEVPVRLGSYMQWDWRHETVPVAKPAGEAS